jgi:hypothetical protein
MGDADRQSAADAISCVSCGAGAAQTGSPIDAPAVARFERQIFNEEVVRLLRRSILLLSCMSVFAMLVASTVSANELKVSAADRTLTGAVALKCLGVEIDGSGIAPGDVVRHALPISYGFRASNKCGVALKNVHMKFVLPKQKIDSAKYMDPVKSPDNEWFSLKPKGNVVSVTVPKIPASTRHFGWSALVEINAHFISGARGKVCNLVFASVNGGKLADFSNPYGPGYENCGTIK